MLNDLTGFAAVPGAEQERFQQLFEAASDKFRQGCLIRSSYHFQLESNQNIKEIKQGHLYF